jgi:hypothetical protein
MTPEGISEVKAINGNCMERKKWAIIYETDYYNNSLPNDALFAGSYPRDKAFCISAL